MERHVPIPVYSLEKIFGPKELRNFKSLPNNFGFAQESGQSGPAYTVFVPNLGQLNQETIKSLGEDEKLAIDFLLTELSNHRDREAKLNWDVLEHIFMQANYLQTIGDDYASQTVGVGPRTTERRTLRFKSAGPQDVREMLLSAFPDEEEGAEDNAMAPLFQLLSHWKDDDTSAKSRKSLDQRPAVPFPSLASQTIHHPFISEDEYRQSLLKEKERTVVVIDILRFPDSEMNPYFTISRLRILALATSDQHLIFRNDKSVFTAEYVQRQFEPRKSAFTMMAPADKILGAEKVEKAFQKDEDSGENGAPPSDGEIDTSLESDPRGDGLQGDNSGRKKWKKAKKLVKRVARTISREIQATRAKKRPAGSGSSAISESGNLNALQDRPSE